MATMVKTPGKIAAGLLKGMGPEGDVVNLVGMYYAMLLARAVSDRMWLLYRQGEVPFAISSNGHEAAQVGSAWVLDRTIDWLVPYYRDIGSVLVKGMTPLEVMLGVFARAADPSSGGRQMPCHFGSRRLRILSGSSPVSTQMPHAAGIALAAKLRGEPSVTLVHFGDGGTSRGDFHEALNFAGLRRLPVIFLCENNRLAISVPFGKQVAGEDIAARAAGYGFPGITVDGTDILAVYQTTLQAMDRARAGEGPTLIDAQVYRFRPHSSNDEDSVYRSPEEVQESLKHDPILLFERELEEVNLLTADRKTQLKARAEAEAEQAARKAKASPLPHPEDALAHVYAAVT